MTPERSRDRAVEPLIASTIRRSSAEAPGPCLDAETMAAWMDGTLPAEEVRRAEAHVADCARCQALVAAMVRTMPETPAVVRWWRRPIVAWTVPIAAAAVLLVAVVLQRERPLPRVDVARVESAEAPAAGQLTDGKVGPPANAPARNERAFAVPRSGAASQSREGTRVQADAARERTAGDVEKRAADALTPPAGARAAGAGKPAPAVAAPSPEPVAPPAAALTESVELKARRDAVNRVATSVIVSSNPGSRWRIGGPGIVDRSMDGGSTWQPQQTGVGVALTAGSSPSPSVCWLVGPQGIVLLSTDGRSWRRLPFPEAVDLVTVAATDDKTAIVTLADGRRLGTTDGGVTWRPAP